MSDPTRAIKKARPFFLNYFNRLANDMNTLTAAPVSATLGDLAFIHGQDDLEEIFETDRSVARVVEDGRKSGDGFVILDTATSIALAGLMMMMGEGVIKEKVKNRDYSPEIQEGFQEIANQLVGAWNDMVEAKMPDGHLFLELPTEHISFGELPSQISLEKTYLSVTVDIQVSSFPAQPARFLMSAGLTSALLGVEVDGAELEGIGPDGQKLGATPSAAASQSGADGAAKSAGPDGKSTPDGGSSPANAGAAATSAAGAAASSAAGAAAATPAAGAAAAAGMGTRPSASAAEADLDGALDGDADAAGGGRRAGSSGPSLETLEGFDARGAGHPGFETLEGMGGSGDGPGLETLEGYNARGSGSDVEFLPATAAPTGARPSFNFTASDGLPVPTAEGSVQFVMNDPPFSLKEDERIIKAINAIRQDGYRQIGIENHNNRLIRVLTESDIRQLMGPFFGTNAMNARDKAIMTLAVGKVAPQQQLVSIPLTGTINQAADLMMEYKLRSLPVVSKQGVLRGFVTLHALLDYFRRKKQA
ncbi:MAG: CBS domain-containing protein [Magnetococcus sp. WYHC-3]